MSKRIQVDYEKEIYYKNKAIVLMDFYKTFVEANIGALWSMDIDLDTPEEFENLTSLMAKHFPNLKNVQKHLFDILTKYVSIWEGGKYNLLETINFYELYKNINKFVFELDEEVKFLKNKNYKKINEKHKDVMSFSKIENIDYKQIKTKVELEEIKQEEEMIKNKIYTYPDLFFESDINQKEFSKDVFDIVIKSFKLDEPNEVNSFFKNVDIVGFKYKVINFFREFDIIHNNEFNCKKDNIGGNLVYYYNYIKNLNIFLLLLENANKKIKKRNEDKMQKFFICSDCQYKWESKKKIGEPAKCPRCNSKNIVSFENLQKMLKK